MTTQRNSEVVAEFPAMTASGNVREAYACRVAGAFTHHYACFPENREPLLAAMEQSAESETGKPLTVKRVIDSG